MDTKKLEVFVKTVKLKSLTKAAEEQGLTQSGVSHIIAAIEEELGLKLLKRSRTGTKLTADGEKILPYMEEILRQEKHMFETASDIGGKIAGEIKIGTFTSVATNWLPSMMKQFQKEYPQVTFKLFDGDYHDVDNWIAGGEVDLGFISLPTKLKCKVTPVYEDPLAAILPKNHPLASHKVIKLKELGKYPFITLLETSSHDANRAFEKARITPDIRFRTKDDYAVMAMVKQGLGVSIVPRLLVRGKSEGICVRDISPEVSRTIALAVVSDKPSPAVAHFADFAVSKVKKS